MDPVPIAYPLQLLGLRKKRSSICIYLEHRAIKLYFDALGLHRDIGGAGSGLQMFESVLLVALKIKDTMIYNDRRSLINVYFNSVYQLNSSHNHYSSGIGITLALLYSLASI